MWNWLKENIFVKDMFLYILLGAFVFYAPSWVAFIIGVSTQNNILLGFSATYVLIWFGPFTPTIPAIFSIAVALKQLVKRIKRQKE
ncbi:MAG: hypothetical protein KJ847_06480 [Firmicutes bacterium]|nr:hypothetical protein [Bacillota bacterium]